MRVQLAIVLALFSALPAGVRIDANYPSGAIFQDRFRDVEVRASSRLAPRAFASERVIDAGRIRIRHLPNDGRYLVSEATGQYMETTSTAGHRTVSKRLTLHVRSEFDALGYAKGGATDPGNLIPIFPGRPVRTGSRWHVSAPVVCAYGSGVAAYAYRVLRVRRARNGDVLAVFSVAMQATLAPPRPLQTSRIAATARGIITWDTTQHERASSHVVVEYHVVAPQYRIVDVQTADDHFRRLR